MKNAYNRTRVGCYKTHCVSYCVSFDVLFGMFINSHVTMEFGNVTIGLPAQLSWLFHFRTSVSVTPISTAMSLSYIVQPLSCHILYAFSRLSLRALATTSSPPPGIRFMNIFLNSGYLNFRFHGPNIENQKRGDCG